MSASGSDGGSWVGSTSRLRDASGGVRPPGGARRRAVRTQLAVDRPAGPRRARWSGRRRRRPGRGTAIRCAPAPRRRRAGRGRRASRAGRSAGRGSQADGAVRPVAEDLADQPGQHPTGSGLDEDPGAGLVHRLDLLDEAAPGAPIWAASSARTASAVGAVRRRRAVGPDRERAARRTDAGPATSAKRSPGAGDQRAVEGAGDRDAASPPRPASRSSRTAALDRLRRPGDDRLPGRVVVGDDHRGRRSGRRPAPARPRRRRRRRRPWCPGPPAARPPRIAPAPRGAAAAAASPGRAPRRRTARPARRSCGRRPCPGVRRAVLSSSCGGEPGHAQRGLGDPGVGERRPSLAACRSASSKAAGGYRTSAVGARRAAGSAAAPGRRRTGRRASRAAGCPGRGRGTRPCPVRVGARPRDRCRAPVVLHRSAARSSVRAVRPGRRRRRRPGPARPAVALPGARVRARSRSRQAGRRCRRPRPSAASATARWAAARSAPRNSEQLGGPGVQAVRGAALSYARSTTWKLVPPKPNALTPGDPFGDRRRPGPRPRCGRRTGWRSASQAGFGCSRCSVGGWTPVVQRPARP